MNEPLPSPGCRLGLYGFTLIELLVVVAILGVLMSLLMPAVGMVRRSAQSASCANNLRQLSMTMQIYIGNEEGLLPPHLNNAAWYGPAGWYGMLAGRKDFTVASAGILRCPSDTSGGFGFNPSSPLNFNTSYAINADIGPDYLYAPPVITYWGWRAFVEVRFPSRAISFADASGPGEHQYKPVTGTYFFGGYYKMPGSWQYPDVAIAWKRHVRFANAACMDGHVDRQGYADALTNNIFFKAQE